MKRTADKPYGYWVGKDEIYPVIEDCEHGIVAEEILKEIFGVRFARLCRRYDPYRIMFRLGFIRVVNEQDGHAVEVRHDVKLSKLQKSYVKDAYNVDRINYQRWSVA